MGIIYRRFNYMIVIIIKIVIRVMWVVVNEMCWVFICRKFFYR